MKSITEQNLRKLLLEAWHDGHAQGCRDTRRTHSLPLQPDAGTPGYDLVKREDKFDKTVGEVTP